MIQYKPSIQRTLEENKYYWGLVIVMITDHMGESDHAKGHEWVKFSFGIQSTATLTTQEFEDLMQTIRDHTKKYWNIIIPLPQ